MNFVCSGMSTILMCVGDLKKVLEGVDDNVLVISVSAVSSVVGVRVSMLSEEKLDRGYDIHLLREDGIDLGVDEEVLMFHSVDEEGI